jgi:phosphoglucomutase
MWVFVHSFIIQEKMRKENLSDAAIAAFRHSYTELVSGSSGMIHESAINAVQSLPDLDADIRGHTSFSPALLQQTVVLKLNGGLGTSMGLDKAKSLLEVKAGNTFLDFTAKQVQSMRKNFNSNVSFMLMNSFNTSKDTLSFLEKYPVFANDPNIELMQNKVPKVEKSTLNPVEWSINRNLEWCPPGHGDLYTALYGSGKLDALLASGIRYMFVSNSDNLGATLDIDLLAYFSERNIPFLMECCRRTEADKKGGHLAQRVADGRLILRESAQCAKEDEGAFQDVSHHKYFNTNNLWVRLDLLKALMDAQGGFVPLPTIFNGKTVDPQQDTSTPVFQLETAMGAAIECFEGAGAVCVSRDRFAPVKKCSDLLLLRSDAYMVDENNVLVLNPRCNGKAPIVDLDDKKYKLVQNLEAATRSGYPSLMDCKKVSIKGEVWLSSRNIFKGEVKIVNNSSEPKVLPPGEYVDTTVDLSNSPGLGPLRPFNVATTPYQDQKPGTSGVRKKTRVFMQPNYIENFVQSTFNALSVSGTDITSGSLVIGGDGRYFNPVAIQTIIKIAVANGVQRVVIGEHGLLSTPAVSAIIRERGPVWQKSFGAFILTASHNPGGPNEDFGIKYNCDNGGPAPERLTDAIYELTKTITSYRICSDFPSVDTSVIGSFTVSSTDNNRHFAVDVISSSEQHVNLLKTIFDFDAIRRLIRRSDFSLKYDCMHGVQGPYAHRVFVEELGASPDVLLNAIAKEDFNGGHADPNLTYARGICDVMGVDTKGLPQTTAVEPPTFGAACDGDADRNMILGKNFFVTPSDSLAILTAHADIIPFFKHQGGLRSVARSMPTSGAVDLVAKKMNLQLFETPTGWKFFGNAMDSKALFNGPQYNPIICGEESFGTGSDHVREKDGMWAVLAWLSILAFYNEDPTQPFVHVEDIVKKHWQEYGRNFYCRYDYEGVDTAAANRLMTHLRSSFNSLRDQVFGSYTVQVADEFTYLDPVDKSISRNQGVRILFTDGSRIVFRLSGTAGSGATVRMYLEKYEGDRSRILAHTAEALRDLVDVAFQISQIKEITGFNEPTVIT